MSSDFAKVNQLSNYARLSHNHTKNQITDLYNYQISASKYNVDIDTDVTITVKVTNQQGNPVVGVTVPVLKDNEAWKSGTTGVNGTFSLTYTADTWGLVMFSTNNNNLQIKVDGFKLIQSNVTYALYVDESTHIAQIRVVRTGVTIVSGHSFIYSDFVIPTKYRPKNTSTAWIMRDNQFLNYVNSAGEIGITNLGNTVTNYSFNFLHEWHY